MSASVSPASESVGPSRSSRLLMGNGLMTVVDSFFAAEASVSGSKNWNEASASSVVEVASPAGAPFPRNAGSLGTSVMSARCRTIEIDRQITPA